MGVFDLFTTAHLEMTEKLQKKIEEAAEQLAAGKLPALKKKKKPVDNKKKRKQPAPKRDLSVRDISAQIIKQRDSLIKGGFKQYEFIANKNCCEVCAALNGKHFPVSKFEIGVNAPPMHDGCRCSIAAWTDSEEYEKWLDFVSRGGTAKQWEAMKKQKR